MSFSKKLTYFLVHELSVSYNEANAWISSGLVQVNGEIVSSNVLLSKTSEVKVRSEIVRAEKQFSHFLFYKPRGIECTLNPNIKNNLLSFFPEGLHLFPAGRLDKASEGLLFLTNDGDMAWKIMHTGMEKEYIVEVDKNIDVEFCDKMGNGVPILGQTTKPCSVTQLEDKKFRIILTQGLNRQIRRMCHYCGYEVQSLKRVRIDRYLLGDLTPGQICKAE